MNLDASLESKMNLIVHLQRGEFEGALVAANALLRESPNDRTAREMIK